MENIKSLMTDFPSIEEVNKEYFDYSVSKLPFLAESEESVSKSFLIAEPPKCLQIQKKGIIKSLHSMKLRLPKNNAREVKGKTPLFVAEQHEEYKEIPISGQLRTEGNKTTFDDIRDKLMKKNVGKLQRMNEKSNDEDKGNKEGDLLIAERNKIEKDKPEPVTRKMIMHASPISCIAPPVDMENDKRQVKLPPSLVSPYYQRKIILGQPLSEDGKKIAEYIWGNKTPEG